MTDLIAGDIVAGLEPDEHVEIRQIKPFGSKTLFEVLPRDEEGWKLISSLLRERETLRLEAKKTEQPKQQSMFEG